MSQQDVPTASTLHLVASDMTDIIENLDTRELDFGDGEDMFDGPGANSAETRVLFSLIYKTMGFKEQDARVFLTSAPITARILEVERFACAQDRFNLTNQRSVSK
ncbi:phospholipase D1 isoform X1, partial [Tachysurus ichikawai]